ncbi:IS256 family transposase [Candidatus Peregrinibacteria bacterium]|nr:IS256 family transposase [Candidatus Peregrinibacteria bacterium]
MKILSYEEYQEKVKNLKTSKDVNNFLKELVAPTLQAMLEAEMTEHLGYEKYGAEGRGSGNSRNGHSEKTIKGNLGQGVLRVPRDRNGNFEPIAVRKYETVESDVEEKIISMYAKGMTTRDINVHMQDIYGVDVSSAMVSAITDKIMPLVQEWRARPLDSIYPIVYLDGIFFKVRSEGKIVQRCGYTILGITQDGMKELLGIWLAESEGAKFWLGVINELKNRGVDDILIACVDGLSGFSDAIKTVFPNAQVQQCIVHQVRNTMKYIPHKYKKQFVSDLKKIYSAPTEEAGLTALEEMKQAWPQYALYLRSWEQKWPELSTFFAYPHAVRRLIYTTNGIESPHRQFRKVTKTTSVFPHEESLIKLLWLAHRDISRKWTMAVRNWSEVIAQFSIMFPDIIKL